MFGSKTMGLLFLIGSVAAAGATYSSRGSCPNEWFTAEYVSIADIVVSPSVLRPIIDTNFTFFKNVMLFTDEEIETVIQNAITFFKTRFGLDFSQSSPGTLGERVFQNATLLPYFVSPEVQFTVTLNRWILTGQTTTKCFENRFGGFLVSFASQTQLFGTYGGEDGIAIFPEETMFYSFYSIPVRRQQPTIIQFSSRTPFRLEPVDGFGILNFDLYNRDLGEGVAQGVYRVTETGEDGKVHLSIRNVYTFPGHPGLN